MVYIYRRILLNYIFGTPHHRLWIVIVDVANKLPIGENIWLSVITIKWIFELVLNYNKELISPYYIKLNCSQLLGLPSTRQWSYFISMVFTLNSPFRPPRECSRIPPRAPRDRCWTLTTNSNPWSKVPTRTNSRGDSHHSRTSLCTVLLMLSEMWRPKIQRLP